MITPGHRRSLNRALHELRRPLQALALLEAGQLVEEPQDHAQATWAPKLDREQAHLVYFLHDEVIVHAPEEQAEQVAALVRAGAREAGGLLFPGEPLDVPVTTAIVEDYGQAK